MFSSNAQAFLCRTRSEFDELCESFRTQITEAVGVQPLFEVAKTGYTPWEPSSSRRSPKFELDVASGGGASMTTGTEGIQSFSNSVKKEFIYFLSISFQNLLN